jgi:anti-sigma B factor antagonist
MPTQLEITVIPGPIAVAILKGKIDGSTFEALIHQVESVLAEGRANMILDFQEVSYISSAGLVALQSILGKVKREGGRLAVAGLAPEVERVLEMTGPTDWLNVYPDVAAAKASFPV